MTADLLKVGMTATVASIQEGDFKVNLLEMGVLPGKKIRFLNQAPWGGPIAFHVEDNVIAIRLAEAKSIDIILSNQ